MKLTKEVLESSRKWEAHFLIINPKIIEENYRRIRESFKKLPFIMQSRQILIREYWELLRISVVVLKLPLLMN